VPQPPQFMASVAAVTHALPHVMVPVLHFLFFFFFFLLA